jgi:hypothetical protein
MAALFWHGMRTGMTDIPIAQEKGCRSSARLFNHYHVDLRDG